MHFASGMHRGRPCPRVMGPATATAPAERAVARRPGGAPGFLGDPGDKVARSGRAAGPCTTPGRSQIVLQIFEHVVSVVARIEIDLVDDRAILEHHRALLQNYKSAFDLLFDGFLAGLGVTDAPHGLERCAAVTVGAVDLSLVRRRRLRPVKLRRETVAAPLVGGGDLSARYFS